MDPIKKDAFEAELAHGRALSLGNQYCRAHASEKPRALAEDLLAKCVNTPEFMLVLDHPKPLSVENTVADLPIVPAGHVRAL